ncbi:hypothetical protein [Comamonas odontotermitis]|uniref:hypothetical protein n=1 Tax=Comamonas odontotermitis TaxID=379895 RepID=UPI001CC4475A|nr:hypothetical protein [Comamonas odontotermitis]UBB15860.1 hypothetical protein LAD35_13520 [Comamonas odontotermitis]
MLVAAALRALAPFSLVAGSPIFHMVSRTLSTLPVRRGRKAHRGAANDGQHAAQVHCFLSASSAAQRSTTGQMSLLDAPDDKPVAPVQGPVDRPIDRIRLPRKPASRRRTQTTAEAASDIFLSVQRCSAQAANDASIKRYWAKPASLQRERGMRWAMTGSMADICAELERLERLERQHC